MYALGRVRPIAVSLAVVLVTLAASLHSFSTGKPPGSLGFTATTTAVTVTEGTSLWEAFGVKLSAQPAGNVSVTVAWASGDADISVSFPDPATLTFTTGNWDSYQYVELTAAEDVDVANGTAIIRVSAGGYTDLDVTATETDNDTMTIVTDVTSVSVSEGSTGTFQAKLSNQPSSDLVVTAARASGDTDITVSGGSSLTFTSANWNTYQTVTLAAAEDADLTNGSATIRLSATDVANKDVTATEVDNDVVQAAYDSTLKAPACAVVGAACDSNTLLNGRDTITGGAEPNQPNTLYNLCSDGTAGTYHSSDGESIDRIQLSTLDASGFATGKTVQVDVTVWAPDSNDRLDLYYTANASANPPTWTLIGTLTPNPALLNTAQVLSTTYVLPYGTLQAVRANFRWVGSADPCTVGGYNDHDDLAFAVTVPPLPDIITNTNTISVPEGSTATFQVKLSSQPWADMAVSVARASGDTDITVSGGSSLTFTTANWATYQTVTLAAAEDDDAANGTATIRASASGLADKDVTATEADNDTLALVTNVTSLSVPEGGTNTFQVKLTARPPGEVSVSVGRASGDTDLSVSGGSSLTFTTGNWNTYQTVTVSAAEDDDAVNGTATIRATATGLTDKDVTATESDNDTVAIVTSTDAVSVPEGGTATFQVKLRAQPSGDVTVSVARASGDTDISVSGGSSLSFTTGNWNTYQTVTLAAAEDADLTDGTATIRLTSTGLTDKDVTATEADNDYTQATYNSFLYAPWCSLPNIAGCDSGTLLVGRDNISGGPEPNSAFNALWFSCLDGTAGTYGTSESIERIRVATLDGSAFLQGRTVRVTVNVIAADATDSLDLYYTADAGADPTTWTYITTLQPSGTGPQVLTTTYTLPSGGSPQAVRAHFRRGGSPSPCNFAPTYDDTDALVFPAPAPVLPTFVTDKDSVTVPEGGTATFQVKLSEAPAGEVSVSVGRQSGDSDISVSGGSSLTFTTGNWNTYQTVTLSAAEDVDLANGDATIRVSASGYTSKDLAATESDNDTLALVTNTTAVSVPEGSTATFQVKLSNQPSGDVAVSVGWVSGDSDISVSGGGSLTFTSANWNTYQTVTLAAAEDGDATNGSATIRATATGLADKDVTATEADNDTGAPAFTDDPLVARSTPIKAVHITELREAIATLRSRYALSTVTWTDATLTAQVTAMKAVHLTELRAALADVYVAAGRSAPTYTTTAIVAGVTVITGTDIAELRAAVLAIW